MVLCAASSHGQGIPQLAAVQPEKGDVVISPPTQPGVEERIARRVWIFLPAYNEELALPPLLNRLQAAMEAAKLDYHVVVVDDGSSDKTLEVAQRHAETMPLTVVVHEINQGLGAALRDGLTWATEQAEDHDVVVSLDADDSHDPALIEQMMQRIDEGAEVVIASRYRPGSEIHGVPWSRRALSYWGGWMFRILFPTRGVRDYTCGFRAYQAGVLRRALEHYGSGLFDQDGFQCMVDLLLKLRRLRPRPRFAEVPFILRYDRKVGESKMRVASTARKTIALLVRRRLGR